MWRLNLVLLVALVSGCVSVTQPVAIGEGRYLITLNARGGLTSDGELLERVRLVWNRASGAACRCDS
jgi:hypothetical protein